MRLPFYVVLLSIYPLLFLYVENAQEVPAIQLIVPTSVAVLSTLCVFVLISLGQGLVSKRTATRGSSNTHVAAVMTSFLIATFYGYSTARSALRSLVGNSLTPVILVLIGLAALTLWVWLIRNPTIAEMSSRPLNTFFLALFGIMLVRSAPSLAGDQTGPLIAIESAWSGLEPAKTVDPLPDIYLIILDGYPSSRVLREYYAFDNSAFTNRMQSLGFTVNDSARSNYAITFLSLASTLNGILLNEETKTIRDARSRDVPYRMIQHNSVMPFLAARGYTVYSLNSGWGATRFSPIADVNLTCSELSEFADLVLRRTAIWPVVEGFTSVHNSRLCALAKLDSIAAVPGPKFVFAHVMLPHPPYVFNRMGMEPGAASALGDMDEWKDKNAYIEQLLYVNARIGATLEQFQRRALTPPIIVVQGDHGSASTGGWNRPSPLLIRERMGILSAISAPGFAIPADSVQTPVATFHVLFSQMFGISTVRPDDSSWFSNYSRPYAFIRIDSLLVGSK